MNGARNRCGGLLLGMGLLVSCAGPHQERHLAPLFSSYSAAGGDIELEGFAGALLTRTTPVTQRMWYFALRPFFSRTQRPGSEEAHTWFLPPLGSFKDRPNERVWQLLPVARFASQIETDGTPTWNLIALPGVYWAKTHDGRTVRAWFPVAGVVERFLSFDRAEFVLFPLWSRVERHGRTSWSVLWPVFGWSRGAGGPRWRVWPLVGRNHWEGRYDRRFFLWPFFLWQRNDLRLPESEHSRMWAFFPFFGRQVRENAHSTTVLWPFFGYTADAETGFWAWDGPFPFVVLQEPGTSEAAERRRFWPLWSRYEGDGLTSRYYLFPFLNLRTEVYSDATKHTTLLLPFWQSWRRVDEGGAERSSFKKLWPLWRSFREEDGRSAAVLALNPLWRTEFIDEHYAWLWELYARQTRGEIARERSWLGMWRRETDADEDRRSLSGIWSRRVYTEAGRRVRETSWLFGLVRWRHREGEGIDWMAPAFPGPGWPLERVPRSIPAARP